MAYQRGTKDSYQRWADEVEDQSYTFDKLLPYFEKSLNFTPPDNAKRGLNATPHYNVRTLGSGDQPLDITFPNYAQSISTWIEKGLDAIGVKPIDGFTSGKLLGSSYNIATINHTTGLRESSETAFLRPALGRPNLVVYTHTLAKRVLMKGTTAVGVSATAGNQTVKLSARKEVILSAGAMQSPQLLMVSGIGPKATLQKHNIPLIADRPGVGQNMWVGVVSHPWLHSMTADYMTGSCFIWTNIQYQPYHRLRSQTTCGLAGSYATVHQRAKRTTLKFRLRLSR